jgi:hypothetical protein
MDPDPIFVRDLQDVNKKLKSQNSRNQCFSYYFFLDYIRIRIRSRILILILILIRIKWIRIGETQTYGYSGSGSATKFKGEANKKKGLENQDAYLEWTVLDGTGSNKGHNNSHYIHCQLELKELRN